PRRSRNEVSFTGFHGPCISDPPKLDGPITKAESKPVAIQVHRRDPCRDFHGPWRLTGVQPPEHHKLPEVSAIGGDQPVAILAELGDFNRLLVESFERDFSRASRGQVPEPYSALLIARCQPMAGGVQRERRNVRTVRLQGGLLSVQTNDSVRSSHRDLAARGGHIHGRTVFRLSINRFEDHFRGPGSGELPLAGRTIEASRNEPSIVL